MRRALLSCALAASLGCGSGGSPAAPSITPGAVPDAAATEAGPASDAGSDASYVVCVPGIDASFEDLRSRIFATKSCGTDMKTNCHSSSGSQAAGNLLDFTLDAGAVYAELLGDGGGTEAINGSGDTPVKRVDPSQPDASLLYIKLTLRTYQDVHYGSGMPANDPGSVCPGTVDAVRAWIAAGAKP